LNIVKVDNISKSFDYYTKEEGLKNSIKNLFHRKKLVKNAVKDISFEIEEGEIVGFLGANGAGKTTTLKMLSGIIYPTSGSATVLGYVPWERRKEFKKQFSIVMGQKNQLWWDLPAIESLYLNKQIYELDDNVYRKNLEMLSDLLVVKDLLNVQVRRLSLGERMKMELIAALIHNPRVLLLDEPTIGLDIISQKNIRDFLKFYNQQLKTTIILTSHYMKDIEDMCKRTIVINQGKLVYDGELNKINTKLDQKKIVKVQFLKPISKDEIQRFGTVKEFSPLSAIIEVNKKDLKTISTVIFNKFEVVDFNIEDISLEDNIALLYKQGGEKNAMDA